jgi:AraC family transcriptional regulator
MEWVERLNVAVNCIEEHLAGEIDYKELARIACCSTYHFQRMFAYMAGIPLSEYIRLRRMSLAAADLQSGREKVIDIALKYGYDSPTAFNRAFKSVHGTAPSLVRSGGVTVKSFPPISFILTVKGAVEMDYRIEKREPFRIVGISMPLEKEVEKNFEAVPLMWQRASADGTVGKIAAMMNGTPAGILGVSACGMARHVDDLERQGCSEVLLRRSAGP